MDVEPREGRPRRSQCHCEPRRPLVVELCFCRTEQWSGAFLIPPWSSAFLSPRFLFFCFVLPDPDPSDSLDLRVVQPIQKLSILFILQLQALFIECFWLTSCWLTTSQRLYFHIRKKYVTLWYCHIIQSQITISFQSQLTNVCKCRKSSKEP